MTTDQERPDGRRRTGLRNDTDQLQIEMRALAELLLDIYEYRLRVDRPIKPQDSDLTLDDGEPPPKIE